MKVMDSLTKEQKQEFDRLQSQQKKPPNQEQMTKEGIEEFMGNHRDAYKRVNGAVRRR